MYSEATGADTLPKGFEGHAPFPVWNLPAPDEKQDRRRRSSGGQLASFYTGTLPRMEHIPAILGQHDAGIFGLVIPAEYGGLGGQSVEYGLVAGELAQGCAATTMAFSMHICATGVMFRGAPVAPEKLREIADLVIGQGKLICASASEPGVTGQLATKEQDRDMLTKQEIALRYLNDLGRASPSLIDNITDDAEHHIIAQLLPFGPFVGKPAIRDQFVPLLRQVFPCGLEFTTQRLIAEDSYVAVECSSRGDLRDGKIYANRYFFLFEFAADRIKMVKEYNDSHYAKETLMLS